MRRALTAISHENQGGSDYSNCGVKTHDGEPRRRCIDPGRRNLEADIKPRLARQNVRGRPEQPLRDELARGAFRPPGDAFEFGDLGPLEPHKRRFLPFSQQKPRVQGRRQTKSSCICTVIGSRDHVKIASAMALQYEQEVSDVMIGILGKVEALRIAQRMYLINTRLCHARKQGSPHCAE